MNFSGLIKNHAIKRALTEQEISQQLKQKVRLDVNPHYQLCVIRMNSTYLESVDKWFGWKGVLSAVAIVIIVTFVALYSSLLHVSITRESNSPDPNDDTFVLVAAAVMIAPLLIAATWTLCRESFAYTHYPLRFNRKTRMVHIFRVDGSALSAHWDSVFFTLRQIANSNQWEVCGHIIDPVTKLILETFSLSYNGALSEKGRLPQSSSCSSDDFVRAHWEFIRRYMEEGPQAVTGQVQFCMPIHKEREHFFVGMERIFANFAGGPALIYWLLFPLCLVLSFSRWFAMRTSAVPQWPQDIEDSCVVESGDPHAIEGATDGERIAVFPDAALAAGVCFRAPPISAQKTKA